jgi:hypothetical protein
MELFMLQAENSAAEVEATSGNHRLVFALIIIGCLGMAWLSWDNQQYREHLRNNPNDAPTWGMYMTQRQQHQQIWDTLHIVSDYMRRGVDVNGDGLVNCIDAAVIFYRYFPGRAIRMMENYNRPTMHHLYIDVWYRGRWISIEPQAHFRNHRSFFMRDVWGSTWNRRFSEDWTHWWRRYVR